MEEILELYDNLSVLFHGCEELAETVKTREELYAYLENAGIVLMEKGTEQDLESVINAANAAHERQGFVYGFQYAMRLATGGTVDFLRKTY